MFESKKKLEVLHTHKLFYNSTNKKQEIKIVQ